jgi:hypothetical protein
MAGGDAMLGTPVLTAVYVEIADHVIPWGRPGPGQPKRLTGIGLVCLAMARVLQGAPAWMICAASRTGTAPPHQIKTAC